MSQEKWYWGTYLDFTAASFMPFWLKMNVLGVGTLPSPQVLVLAMSCRVFIAFILAINIWHT